MIRDLLKSLSLIIVSLCICGHGILLGQTPKATADKKTEKVKKPYLLLKPGRNIHYRLGYSDFHIYRSSAHPNTGYVTFKNRKVANYHITHSLAPHSVGLAYLIGSRSVISVDEREFSAGVRKAAEAWKKEIKRKGKHVIFKQRPKFKRKKPLQQSKSGTKSRPIKIPRLGSHHKFWQNDSKKLT